MPSWSKSTSEPDYAPFTFALEDGVGTLAPAVGSVLSYLVEGIDIAVQGPDEFPAGVTGYYNDNQFWIDYALFGDTLTNYFQWRGGLLVSPGQVFQVVIGTVGLTSAQGVVWGTVMRGLQVI